MDERFGRTALLLGEDAIEELKNARVAVFGVGGVGGYVCEALARSGVGTLDLVDCDTVSISNCNRQILALSSTVGCEKTDVMRERLQDINPQIAVNTHNVFFTPETADSFDFTKYTYVVDAIDTVAGKIELAVRCEALQIPLISAMGTGNKLHPELFEITDIYKTSVCPLARVMRTELKKRGVKKLKVVYSKETPVKPQGGAPTENGRHLPGSTAFCPPAAGMILAGAVVRDILNLK